MVPYKFGHTDVFAEGYSAPQCTLPAKMHSGKWGQRFIAAYKTAILGLNTNFKCL